MDEQRKSRLSFARCAAMAAAVTILASCGGSDTNIVGGSGPPAYSAVAQVKVSQPTSFPAGCEGVPPDGILYPDTAIEPQIAANLLNNSFLIATWQQNRWSSGGSQAIGVSISSDGGNTWVPANAPFFSRCAGGNSGNAGNYARASNAWVSVAPSGVAYALALAFTGEVFAPASASAMLVSQSIDGGANWALPIALIQDGAAFFNDKGSLTADPTDSNYVYAVWDRLNAQNNTGPSFFSLTANANSSWSTARSIYDPGADNQTINNIIVVTPDDTLIDLFNEIDGLSGSTSTSHLKAMLSSDHGTTWTPRSWPRTCSVWAPWTPTTITAYATACSCSLRRLGPTASSTLPGRMRASPAAATTVSPSAIPRTTVDLVNPGAGERGPLRAGVHANLGRQPLRHDRRDVLRPAQRALLDN